jgi:hypothetical protein
VEGVCRSRGGSLILDLPGVPARPDRSLRSLRGSSSLRTGTARARGDGRARQRSTAIRRPDPGTRAPGRRRLDVRAR